MINEIPSLDRGGLRRFGLTTGAIVAFLFGIVFPYVLNVDWPRWPWIVFAALGLCAIIAPSRLGYVYRGWMRFGMLLGKITTPFLLTLVFVISILPAALIMRLFGKDPMRRGFDESSSYRVVAKQPSVENLDKPY